MARTLNNEYLSQIADSVDPGGGEGGRQLNNDYLKRIAEAMDGAGPQSEIDVSRLVGVISEDNLPSYVDDVVEGYLYNGAFYEDSQHTESITPSDGKVYVDVSTNTSYRWSGSAYVSIGKTMEVASQAEAEAGQDNEKYMTALRTKQAVAAQVTGLSSQDIADIKAVM